MTHEWVTGFPPFRGSFTIEESTITRVEPEAFANFDTLLAPFLRYDNLSYPEVQQALQEFIFNMNVPTRVGFQTPFTNITMDMQPPRNMADEAVIIGGELQDVTYGDFLV